MKKWEYKVLYITQLNLNSPLCLENDLIALGEEGWELSHVLQEVWIVFKRMRTEDDGE